MPFIPLFAGGGPTDVPDVDTFTLSDTGVLDVAVTDTETGTVTDTGVGSAAPADSDTAALSDTESLTQGNFFADTDTFTVSDTGAVTIVQVDDSDSFTLDDSATGGDTAVWGPPAGLIATPVSDTQIDLTWDPVTGAIGYDIERDGVVIASDVAGTSYSDTGLAPTTTYTYRARSVR